MQKDIIRTAYLSLLASPGQPAVSGVPKVSESLLKAFESLDGLDINVISLIDSLPEPIDCERPHVRYHYYPCKAHGKTLTLYLREILFLKRKLRNLKPLIVHGQPTSEYLFSTVFSGLPHVITIHGLVAREVSGSSRASPSRLAASIRHLLDSLTIHKARNIICISEYVSKYLRGKTAANLWHIPNPIDPEFFDLPLPDRKGLRILCTGTISERKNQQLLVKACKILEAQNVSFECRIVGQETPVADTLRTMISSIGLQGQTVIEGMVSTKRLMDLYAWCNVVTLPSLEETSPLSLIQGMASSRCVMGANSAGIPFLLNGGLYGTLFSPEDPSDLAGQLEAMSHDGSPFWARADKAAMFASSSFRPDSVAKRTIDVYRAVINAEGARI